MVDWWSLPQEHQLGDMALVHLPIIPIMRGIVGELVINTERLEANVEFVEIHGIVGQGENVHIGDGVLM